VQRPKDQLLSRLSSDEDLATFGSEIRALRKARKMTLADLAQASGVSVSHISAIERGSASPTLSKITGIAEGLGVPEEWFFTRRKGEGPLERTYVVRRANRRSLNLLYGETPETCGYADELLSSSLGGGFHLGISEYPPYSNKVPDDFFVRDGEAHGLVLEGELTLTLEDEVITVREGDSFSFPGNILHSTRNKSAKPAKLIWVNSPVIIPRFAVHEEDRTLPETKETATYKRSGS
jgi:transcriptional regulator with XRE-family HTH domain